MLFRITYEREISDKNDNCCKGFGGYIVTEVIYKMAHDWSEVMRSIPDQWNVKEVKEVSV